MNPSLSPEPVGTPEKEADLSRRKKLALICPNPATPAELDKAADLILAYPPAAPVVRRFNTFDRETRVCRSMPVRGGS